VEDIVNRKLAIPALLALGAVAVAARPAPAPWNVDAAHTVVAFSVRHFFTPVRGQFDQFEVNLAYDPAVPENSTVRVTIPVASINTGNDRRDTHLRSGDFFEADAHPEITFVSEHVRKLSDTELLVTGPLTIKGISRQVDLAVKILGVMDVPGEMQGKLGGVTNIASFETTLKLDRRDFGVGTGNWAMTAIVGSDVDITIAVEANR
jgi:polyisoprenoid-binding protein YceI